MATDLSQRTAYAGMGMSRTDYEAVYRNDPEWGLYGLHCHDFYEFYVFFSGAKYYCIDNQIYPLERGHLMVIPPFRMHGLIGDQLPTDYERCFLYISPGMIRMCGNGQIDLEQYFDTHVNSGNLQFRMTAEESDTCRRLLKSLMQSQDDNSPLGRFDNYTIMLQFLSIVCQVMHRSHETINPIVVNEAMQEILSYVNQNYTGSIKLEQLAHKFGVSVSFLSHEFVKYTGRSVYDYVLYRRVLLAKEMIHSATPLSEVLFIAASTTIPASCGPSRAWRECRPRHTAKAGRPDATENPRFDGVFTIGRGLLCYAAFFRSRRAILPIHMGPSVSSSTSRIITRA